MIPVFHQKGFDVLGQIIAEFVENFSALPFREAESACGRVDKTARGLVSVTEQALAEGERVDRQSHAIDQGMPAIGLAGFDCLEVALNDSIIAKRAELSDLSLPHAAAGMGESLEGGFSGQVLVEGNEFADFMARSVAMRQLNGRQFDG